MKTLTFLIDIENFKKFENLRLYLYENTKNYQFAFKNKYFSIIVEEFKELLSSNNIYKTTTDTNLVIKRGRRRIDENQTYKTLSIGNIPQETYQEFINIGYSIISLEKNENADKYSTYYYMVKILNFVEKNTANIINKYKEKEKKGNKNCPFPMLTPNIL